MHDYFIVTHIPAFYKINLYNELAKKLKIFVVFIASNTKEKRSDDFVTIQNAKFNYDVLFNGNFQDRNIFKNIKKLRKITKNIKYKKVIVSGWDLEEFWYLVFLNKKSKNCLSLESTINESKVEGLKGLIKKLFLSRISTVFASGKLHVDLLKALNYKSDIKITNGVGIINKPPFAEQYKKYKKKFLFIGRLSEEKNVRLLVEIFNDLPEYYLTIIGEGSLGDDLKKIANKNINFTGKVENNNLKNYFISNDIFILPSISEPWGLVVEEAFYFGLPVIVSKSCGVSELVKHGINGYLFDLLDINNLKQIILNIDDLTYQKLRKNIGKFYIDKKDLVQVGVYI